MHLVAGETAASVPAVGAPTVMACLTVEPRFSGIGMKAMVMVPIRLPPFQRQLLGCELSSGVLLSGLIRVPRGTETPGCCRGQASGAPQGMVIES